MKCALFPTSLVLTLLCIAPIESKQVPAHVSKGALSALMASIKKTLGLAPQEVIKPMPQPETVKLAVVAAGIQVKTMEEIIKEATNPTNAGKFGLAALIRTMQEEATNANNPHKDLFKKEIPTAEELKASDGGLLTARKIANKLDPITQQALDAAFAGKNLGFSERVKLFRQFISA